MARRVLEVIFSAVLFIVAAAGCAMAFADSGWRGWIGWTGHASTLLVGLAAVSTLMGAARLAARRPLARDERRARRHVALIAVALAAAWALQTWSWWDAMGGVDAAGRGWWTAWEETRNVHAMLAASDLFPAFGVVAWLLVGRRAAAAPTERREAS